MIETHFQRYPEPSHLEEWRCVSRGVPAGGVEVESCEEPAVACVRNDWDDGTDRPPAYCRSCVEERGFYGDKPLWVPDLAVGVVYLQIVGPS